MMHDQHTPDHTQPDPFALAFMRGIAAAMTGDQDGITRATQEIQAQTAAYIEQAGR